jgi:hypothetical protein
MRRSASAALLLRSAGRIALLQRYYVQGMASTGVKG